MQLRPYQTQCLAAIAAAGQGKWLCQLATGLGKTVIFANIPRPEGSKTLILSHRRELVMQPIKYFSCPVTVEMGEKTGTKLEELAPVTSASIQTMLRRKSAYTPDAFDMIIVDEAHHAASESYRQVLDYFQPKTLLGFTATPNRGAGIGLESVFDKIIFQKDLRSGILDGWLSPIQCRRVNIGYDLSGVATRMGDYAPGDLERAVNIDHCNIAIAMIVKQIAELPALVFCVDVAHAEAVAAEINKFCPNYAVAVSAKSKDRDRIVADYKAGKIPVLVNCALFTEGTDLPNTKTVIIARPTKSAALYTQMVGRGTRLSDGKDHCLLIDCVGVSRTPICTAPTLVGLDLSTVAEKYQPEIEGDLLADIPDKIMTKSDTPESWIQNVRLVDLWEKSSGYVLHNVNYIRRPDGSLTLNLPAKGESTAERIIISAPDLTGKAYIVYNSYPVPPQPAQECYDFVLKYLRERCSDRRPLWDLTSAKRWGSVPANEKQIDYIQKLAKRKRINVSAVMDKLTKLQASHLIENLKGK